MDITPDDYKKFIAILLAGEVASRSKGIFGKDAVAWSWYDCDEDGIPMYRGRDLTEIEIQILESTEGYYEA